MPHSSPTKNRFSPHCRKEGHRQSLPARTGLFAALVLCFAAISGCASPPPATDPPVTPPKAFSDTGTADVPDRWWTVFDDPGLNRTIERALSANFNLKTAWQRLSEARAIAERQSADLFFELDGVAEGETRRAETEDTDQIQLGLAAAYEVDLWGRIRAEVDAERLRARAEKADLQTAALSLSAEVARTWYRLAEAGAQLRLLKDQVAANEKVLRLLKSRFASGRIRSADVLRQRQLLESTRQQQYAAESRIQVLVHQLAVLSGRPPRAGFPADMHQKHPDLAPIPPLPATGLPADLVRRRPDVDQALLRLKAADADTAAAVSNQYPRLTLSASLSTSNDAGSDLFTDWARSFSGSLVAPLLDAGRRQAEVDRSQAFKKQRLYQYGQAVLTAFQEVEDALVREKKQVQQIESIEARVRLAERTYRQLRTEYINGAADFIDVLTALTEAQQLRRELISARRERMEIRIGLYRAVAGGFETPMTAEQKP